MRGIIAIAVIVVLVGGVVWMAPAKTATPPVPPTPGKSDNTGANPINQVLPPVSMVLECEGGQRNEKTPEGVVVMKVRTNSEGKAITFIEVSDDEVFKNSGWKDKFKTAPKPDENPPGMCRYEFEAPRDDTYYVNLHAKWLDSCGNSVWVKIDDGTYTNLEDEWGKIGEKNYKWEWHQVLAGGEAKTFELKKGKHTLVMALREHGMWLDKWLITTDAFRPIEK